MFADVVAVVFQTSLANVRPLYSLRPGRHTTSRDDDNAVSGNHHNCKFDQYKMRPWLVVAAAALAALPAGLAVDYAGGLCTTVVDFSLKDGTDFAKVDQLAEQTYALFPRWVTRVSRAECITNRSGTHLTERCARRLHRIASPRCGSFRA